MLYESVKAHIVPLRICAAFELITVIIRSSIRTSGFNLHRVMGNRRRRCSPLCLSYRGSAQCDGWQCNAQGRNGGNKCEFDLIHDLSPVLCSKQRRMLAAHEMRSMQVIFDYISFNTPFVKIE